MAALIGNQQLLNQATQPKPDLNDLTYFNNRSYGGITQDEVNSNRGQAALAAAQKYDPNAAYNPTYGSDGQLLGYQFQFDPSKLPGAGTTGQLGGSNTVQSNGHYAGGSGFMPRFSTVQEHMNLINPNAVANSDHYGRITDNRNIYQKDDIFSKLGPMIPLAFATLMSGGALSPIMSLALKTPQMLNSFVNNGFNPYSLAGMGLSFIPGVSPVMANLGRAGLNYIGSQQRGG